MNIACAQRYSIMIAIIACFLSCYQPIRQSAQESSMQISILPSEVPKTSMIINVTDTFQQVIPGATIRLISDSQSILYSTSTNIEGTATIQDILPMKDYVIAISSLGYVPIVKDQLVIPSSSSLHVTVKLYAPHALE